MTTESLLERPKRADARRNYDKLIEAARSAFADKGADTSLEEIARRAEVGIGTLYRHFPSRPALLEAVYVGEVEALCQSAEDSRDLPPWDALVGWLRRFVAYITTKRELSSELMATIGEQSAVFGRCHDAIKRAGEPLLERATSARVVRPDVALIDVIRLVSGITLLQRSAPEDIDRVLMLALDGLRYCPAE